MTQVLRSPLWTLRDAGGRIASERTSQPEVHARALRDKPRDIWFDARMTDAPSKLQAGSDRRAEPEKREKPIPTGRLRRTARVGELVGGQAVRSYGTRAANLTRSQAARQVNDTKVANVPTLGYAPLWMSGIF